MPICRERLVRKHSPKHRGMDVRSPFSVGNGDFCFSADITGLQTFEQEYSQALPLCTLSSWGWHTEPMPQDLIGSSLRLKEYDTYGRKVGYPASAEGQEELFYWSRMNPHRFHLGRLGLVQIAENGKIGDIKKVEEVNQELDLWDGLLTSSFEIEHQDVQVETCCHPTLDAAAFSVRSSLIETQSLGVLLKFPYGSPAVPAADWESPDKHRTEIAAQQSDQVTLLRVMNSERYFVTIRYSEGVMVQRVGKHEFLFYQNHAGRMMELVCSFSCAPLRASLPSYEPVQRAAAAHWNSFWSHGGIIDLSESKDPRAHEIERRVILSQYLTAIQCSGSMLPQETGLTCNSWYGKAHLEMHFWHAAHFALWGRTHMLENSLWWYYSILDSARQRAQHQGYAGVRWPKMVGPDGQESPSPINPLLIWQQPHPIVYAELCYRARPSIALLQTYKDVVFNTAEFMASFAHYDAQMDRYVLGPPVIPAQENHQPEVTINPTFELAYWGFALSIAQKWRQRLGLKRNHQWDNVLEKLSKLPVNDGVYVAHENCPDTFERFNYDHPSMLAPLGLLPGSAGVDEDIMSNTLKKVLKEWEWEHTWGWDYPMAAMTAARLGQQSLAIDILLMDTPKNAYSSNGHVWQRPDLPIYLPANGGLLLAIGMMAAGWDGSGVHHAPGFPCNKDWVVKYEDILPWF